VSGRKAQLIFSLAVVGLGLLVPIVIRTDYMLNIVFRVSYSPAWDWLGTGWGAIADSFRSVMPHISGWVRMV